MRTIFRLFYKDILRRRRRPVAVLLMLAFPLVFTAVLTVVLDQTDAPGRALLIFDDRDGGAAGEMARALFETAALRALVEVDGASDHGGDAHRSSQRVADGTAAAFLILPAGTTQRLRAGEPPALELVVSPLPRDAGTETARQAAELLAEVLSMASGLGLEPARIDDLLRETSLPVEVLEAPRAGPGIFLLVLPGISVFAIFLLGDQLMRDLLVEAQLGTLRRQLAAPVRGFEIVAAKLLVIAVIAGGAFTILIGIAWSAVGLPVQLPGLALLVLSLAVAVSGYAATIYGVTRSEIQGATLAALVYLTLAFTGGNFVPVDRLPEALRGLVPFSPFYWGMRGLGDLLQGGGVEVVVVPMAVLGATGTVLLIVGSMLLERKVYEGAG